MYFRMSNICSRKLDVQEANVSLSQFLQNQKLFLSMLVCEWMESPALDLWDVVIEVLHSLKNTHQAARDHCRKEKVDDPVPRRRARNQKHQPQHQIENKQKLMNCPMWITLSQAQKPSRFEAQLYVLKGNEAVIKMNIKGRSPTTRQVSRTHRVAFG